MLNTPALWQRSPPNAIRSKGVAIRMVDANVSEIIAVLILLSSFVLCFAASHDLLKSGKYKGCTDYDKYNCGYDVGHCRRNACRTLHINSTVLQCWTAVTSMAPIIPPIAPLHAMTWRIVFFGFIPAYCASTGLDPTILISCPKDIL